LFVHKKERGDSEDLIFAEDQTFLSPLFIIPYIGICPIRLNRLAYLELAFPVPGQPDPALKIKSNKTGLHSPFTIRDII
jgi:hypothetical protein